MKKKSKFMEEFKKFILRGNVMDMAVGVIVGGAFTANCDVTECGYPDTYSGVIRRNGFLLPMREAWQRGECTGITLR